MAAPAAERADARTMTLAAHLREARTRAIRVAIGLVAGVVVGYALSDQILEVLRAPITALAESRNASLNYDSVTGAFDLKVRIAVFAGIALSSPVWLHQMFAFFVPGLTRRERRYTLGFFVAAAPLFVAGCVAGFLLFPHIVEVLAGFAPDEDSTLLTASYYVDFVMKLVLAVGVAFVLPVFVVLLNAIGVLPGRSVVRSWRLVLIGIVLFAAIATPAADVMSMFLLAAPMAVLFAGAAVIAVLHDRAAKRRAVADAASADSAVSERASAAADPEPAPEPTRV